MNSEDLEKGFDLERKAASYLWNQGFLPLLDVKIKIETKITQEESQLSDITDIDVLGYKFGPCMSKRTFFIDCKESRKSGNFNHIINRYGIFKIFNFDELLILRPKVTEVSQNFCQEIGIKILNSNQFNKEIEDKKTGIGNIESNITRLDIIRGLNKNENYFLYNAYNFLLEKNIYNRLKSLVRLNKNLMDEKLSSKISEKGFILLTFLFFELIEITIGEIAEKSFFLWSKHHFEKVLSQGFIGDIDLKKKVYQIMIELDSTDNENKNQHFPTNESFLPPFYNILKSLLKQIHNNPLEFQRLLRYNNFIIHEFGLRGKNFNLSLIKKNFGDFNRDLFANWNISILAILYDDYERPDFALKMFT